MQSNHYINPYQPRHPYSLTNKQRQFLKHWEKQKETPRFVYFLFNGVIKKISWVFILFKVIQLLFFKEQSYNFYVTGFGIVFLFIEILFWIFCGLTFGWLEYTKKESEYELFHSMRHF
jgi:hypothetical protein